MGLGADDGQPEAHRSGGGNHACRLHRGSGHGRSAAEVATYVVETADRRYDLQSMVAFAIEKKTAYIKLDKGEQRLLVIKNERK